MRSAKGRTSRRISLPLLVLTCLAFTLAASSTLVFAQGPIIQVDIKNPVEADESCDFHFRTLKAALENCEVPEFATIEVDPGTYDEGELTVDSKGVIIRSTDTAQRTKINGCFKITAQQVMLRGFDINADPEVLGPIMSNAALCANAITVSDRDVELHDNLVHESAQSAIYIESFSDGVLIVNNHLFNNTASGVHVLSDSESLQINQNRIRSNGGSGILFEGHSDRFSIQGNELDLNSSEGILIMNSDMGTIANNTITANMLDGVKLLHANGHRVFDNTISASGDYGVSVVGSDNNEVNTNNLENNRGGGVKLSGNGTSSQENTIDDNNIVGNAAGGSGILLEGDVTGSIISDNTIQQSSIGIRLMLNVDSPGPGQPTNNDIDNNTIENSDDDAILVEASLGLNEIKLNTIRNNNNVGIHIVGGTGNDEIASNIIDNNGGDGIRIEGSERNTIRENTLTFNGGSNGVSDSVDDGGAIVLIDTSSTSVRQNTLQDGEGNGLLIHNASDSKIIGNTIERFQQDGVKGFGTSNILMEENTVQNNRERGLAFENCADTDPSDNAIDLQLNIITSNTLGGIFLAGCSNPHMQMNSITENGRYGLWVDGSGNGVIEARRNWWGDPKGPAGVFEGRGDAVIMLGLAGGNSFQLENDQVLEAVLPWLTDRPDQQIEASVRGFILNDFGPSKVELDATDQTHARVSFFNVEQEERGIAILARYVTPLPNENSFMQPGELAGAVKSISLLTNGFSSGTAIIDIEYLDSELSEGTDKATLRLHYWDGSAWQELPGKSLVDVNLIEGEIDVALLRDVVIIAIAPQQQ